MVERDQPPHRRPCERIRFEHGAHRYYATIGRHPETGRLTEVFLQCAKSGTELEALARDCAVLTSLCLQFGCPVETLQRAVTRLDDGRAAGPLGCLLDKLGREYSS